MSTSPAKGFAEELQHKLLQGAAVSSQQLGRAGGDAATTALPFAGPGCLLMWN
jgi:hypothetical protein